jgi:hypothetical protein
LESPEGCSSLASVASRCVSSSILDDDIKMKWWNQRQLNWVFESHLAIQSVTKDPCNLCIHVTYYNLERKRERFVVWNWKPFDVVQSNKHPVPFSVSMPLDWLGWQLLIIDMPNHRQPSKPISHPLLRRQGDNILVIPELIRFVISSLHTNPFFICSIQSPSWYFSERSQSRRG